jgi:hypothetical protein
MPATTILKHTATILQVVSLAGFAILIMSRNLAPLDVKAWSQLVVLSLLPIVLQVLACRALRDPVIHAASIVASLLIIILLCDDIFSPFYFSVALLFSLPVAVVVMFLGWVAFFLRRWLRTTRPPDQIRSTPTPGTPDD